MTATVELDKYLQAFGKRLKYVCLARGGAILAAVTLITCVALAYYAINTGFATGVVITSRLLLLAVFAAILYLLLIKPLRRLEQDAAQNIERRAPAYAGRIVTYREMQDPHHPFRELLAEDALKISAAQSVENLISRREYTLPGSIAALCFFILLALFIAGPGLLNYSLRHLLAGWAFSGLLPPQTIAVIPGDELVRRGGNVRVRAVMSGFTPEHAQVNVKIGNKDWQSVEMVSRPEGFEFTFFSVREPLQYYVASTGIRSPTFQIKVVDIPSIRDLKLTYHYPDWTRHPPETVEHGGDVRAVAGTLIDVEVVTDQPLPAGLLVLNSDAHPLASAGNSARSSFAISADGQYFIAAQLGDEQVRLTDDYFIKVLEDGKPEIHFTRPGRDWNATNIEEVTARVEAKDDFALEGLSLHYAVNGGDWQTLPLTYNGRDAADDHVFLLENLRARGEPLAPGDLITYYGEARDRLNTSQTDMYFIEVQPFDRRYSQSQQMGGGGGGGQNDPQQEISQRQKEIIVSTWNLLRTQAGKGQGDMSQTVQDNATLLSELQQTLAGQAKTLADRTRARELTTADQRIKTFVESMENAAKAMQPAAERLKGHDLQAAIQPEQEALQHLLRAESVFNDIQISFQRGGGGGGGFQPGRDLAEMFELEMDLEKNQYETGSSASRQEPAEAADDAMQKLADLARRQEQLANAFQQQQQLTPAQRWQQEMLRREAEELRRQLQNRQQQQAGNQQGQGQDQSGQAAGGGGSASNELNRRLDSAIRAMNEATEAMRGNNSSERLQQAVQEAQRQLQQARNQVSADQQSSMQQQFQNMAESATDLRLQQARVDNALQNAMRQALALRGENENTITNPLTAEEESNLAEQKRAILQQLQSLRQDMQAAAKNYRDQQPDAVRKLEQANAELRDAEIDTRLDIAANYIERGAALYIASSESVVTNSLRNLEKNLAQARALASGAEQPGTGDLDRALAQTQALRRELQQLTNASPGQNGQPGNQSAQSGQATAGNTGQAGSGNAIGNGLRGNWNGGWYGWGRPNGIIQPGDRQRLNDELDATASAINPIVPELRAQGLTDKEIDEIYRKLRNLALVPRDGRKNEVVLQEELTKRLALLEQLELQLQRSMRKDQPGTVRGAMTEPVSAEFKDAVAEYYRRLSND